MLSSIDQNPPCVFPTYIAVLRLKHIAYRVPYGVRLHLPEGIIEGTGCILGTQPVVAQKYALATVLDAIAASDRALKTKVILRREYLRQALDFGRTRKTRLQYGMHVDALKTDEELFERTPILFDMYGVGMRMADPNNEEEVRELSIIEKNLTMQGWKDPSLFRNSPPFHPKLPL
mgnify:CR=1 FL=1